MSLDTLSIGCPLVQWKGEKGRCNWCDKELTGRQQRWCSSTCSEAYGRNHWWTAAREAAKDRDGWKCTQCGSDSALEVHHIEAAVGRHSRADCIHHVDNLVTLCHWCHLAAEQLKRLGSGFRPSGEGAKQEVLGL